MGFFYFFNSIFMNSKKSKGIAEPYWTDLVQLWFEFCREHFNEEPVFEGSAPRDYKQIIKSIRERALATDVEWTVDEAKTRVYKFLLFAKNSSTWLAKNFTLSNINRNKQSIFFNLRASIQRQPQHPFDNG